MKQDRHNVLSHAAIYLVARGAPGIIAFLSIPLFSRLLSPADFGQYALVVATAALANALLFQWLRLSLVRYLPAYRENQTALQSTIVSVSLSLIVISGAVLAVLWLLPFSAWWKAYLVPCWVLLAVQSLFELACEYTRAAIQPWRYMGMQIAKSFATVALGVLLIVFGAAWRGPIFGLVIGMAAAVAWVWGSDWSGIRPTIDREILRRLMHYGIPLSLTVALTVVISSSDRFLIAWLLGKESAGYYSVAVDFTSQTLTLLMMAIQLALFPIAVRAFEEHGKEAAQEKMKLNASLLMGIGVPAAVGLVVLAPGISNAVLGRDFRGPAAHIMPLVAFGTFLAGFKAYHFDSAFQFAHRTIHQVWIVLIAAVVNIVLNVIAIPRYGINGAAAASVIAYLISIVLTIQLGRRYFVLPFPRSASLQVLLAAAVMAALLYPLRQHQSIAAVALEIIAGALVYALVLLSFNFLDARNLLIKKLAPGADLQQNAEVHSTSDDRARARSTEAVVSLSRGTLV